LTGYVNDFAKTIGTKSMDVQYQQLALQFSHTFKPAEQHKVTWGIDSRSDLIDASNSDPLPMEQSFIPTGIVGMYVQDDWNFAPRWTLGLGSRIDYEFYGGFEPSARASLSYAPDDKSLVYTAVSRAFQMPTLPFRFADVQILDGLIDNSGNCDMRATSVIAYEVGYRRSFFNKRLESSSNLYWNEYRDAFGLYPKFSLSDLFAINMQNIGDYSTYGYELENRFQVTKKLFLLANYTLQFMDWRGDIDFNFGADSISLPKHKFMVGPRYNLTDNLHLSSQLHYVDAVKAPNPNNPFVSNHFEPYFRLDCRVEYEFWKKQAAVAFGVSNLLNKDHYEGTSAFLNNAEVPRLVYAEFRVTFK
jgi:outer membrane receptor protein involved in Fe transport